MNSTPLSFQLLHSQWPRSTKTPTWSNWISLKPPWHRSCVGINQYSRENVKSVKFGRSSSQQKTLYLTEDSRLQTLSGAGDLSYTDTNMGRSFVCCFVCFSIRQFDFCTIHSCLLNINSQVHRTHAGYQWKLLLEYKNAKILNQSAGQSAQIYQKIMS